MTQKKPTEEDATKDVTNISHQAMARISELGINPLPEIYELWFRYFQGDPEVVREIDAQAGRIDETACLKLHKHHLSDSARGDAVRRISEQVQSAMAELASVVHSARADANEYGGALEGAGQKIAESVELEDLSDAISDIVADTRRMVQKNHELEFQLVTSSTQVAELNKNLDNIKREAMTDGLTGLANRRAFDKQISDWILETSRWQNGLCLVMLDIDHFKKFNDAYGHQMGDQVLRLVARTLTDGIRGRDFAARFGGEEFAIILPETDIDAGALISDRLRRSVEDKEVVNRSSHQTMGSITLSVGVASYLKGESVSDFIGRADAALYKAKKEGRNRVVAAGLVQ